MPANRINRKALVSLMQALVQINSVNPSLSSDVLVQSIIDFCNS